MNVKQIWPPFSLQLFNDTVTKEALIEFLKKQPDGTKSIATVEAIEVAYRTEIERKAIDNKTVRTKLIETEKTLKTFKKITVLTARNLVLMMESKAGWLAMPGP